MLEEPPRMMLHSQARGSKDKGRGGASLPPPSFCTLLISSFGSSWSSCRSKAGKLQKDSPFLSAGAVKARCLGSGDFSPGAGTDGSGPVCRSGAAPARCGNTGGAGGIRLLAARNCQLQTLQNERKKLNENPKKKRLCLGRDREVSEPKPTWQEGMRCL